MIKGGKGGANTKTGLKFEKRTSLVKKLIKVKGYEVSKQTSILYRGQEVALNLRKGLLYKFLEARGVNYKDFISKKLLPDEAIYLTSQKKLFIVELKFQNTSGSVDEKLQTCDFKRKEYIKLMSSLRIEVEYIYVLNDWFNKPEYKDVREYIHSVGCHYFFNYLPLNELGLP